MKKNKNGKQPLNINISFNINPKHITQTQHNANMKMAQNVFDSNGQSPPKGRQQSRGHQGNQSQKYKNTHAHSNRPNHGSFQTEQLDQKSMDRLKKAILTKINNIDIHIPIPPTRKDVQQSERQQSKSSLMSAKMEEFTKTQNNYQAQASNPRMHLNLHTFNEQKSKILFNNQPSKIFRVQTLRKLKTDKKNSVSQTKQLSKLLSQERYQSCITQRKSRSCRDGIKKSKKRSEKEDSLKDKLEKFKVDMMKLALFYEQNEVLKTKMSSEYHNMRSRQISKDNVYYLTQGEEHQKAQQIRHFQQKGTKQENQVTAKERFEPFETFKEQYSSKKQEYFDDQSQKEETKNIINFYKNLSSGTYEREQVVQIIDCISDKTQKFGYAQGEFTPQGSLDNLKCMTEKSEMGDTKNVQMLTNFVKFIKQNYKSGEKMKQNMDSLLSKFLEGQTALNEYKQDPIVDEQQQKQRVILYENNEFMVQIDENINDELVSIPHLSNNITEKYPIQPELLVQLQNWQKQYTQELLSMKGKMWRQYRNIRNQVQNRICSGSNYKPLNTIKSKKTNKIMKCLSQKILKKKFSQTEINPRVWLKNKCEIEAVSNQGNLPIQRDSTKYQYHELNQNLLLSANDESQQQLSDQRNLNSRVIFNQLDESEGKDDSVDIQIPDLKTIHVEEEQPFAFKHLAIEDKEDIFQFVFLDLCIELYQDYVQKQGLLKGRGVQNISAERILDSLRRHIEQEKKNKVNKNVKKIGISTNVNTIKVFLQQLKTFLTDKSYQNSPSSLLVKKLNTPLGPSNRQMLRSLRIPVFEENQKEDLDQEYQEGDLLILQPDWFLKFQNQVIHIQELEFQKYYQAEERDKQRINFLRNCTHIHHKAIYDALNENLDYCRIFGIWGQPFAWKTKPSFNHLIESKNTDACFNKAASEVIRSSMFSCGLIANKEESLIRDLASNEQYVKRLQDERIYKYLQDFVVDMEQKWSFHDDQETETYMEMSQVVWINLLNEVILDLEKVNILDF